MKKLESSSTRYVVLAACAVIGGATFAAMSFAETAHAETAPVTAAKATATPKTTATPKASKPKTTRVRGTANARILHAVKDAPPVDVYIDNKKVLSSASYKSVSDYTSFNSGKHAIKVTPEGKSAALVSGDVTFTKDSYLTLAVYGTAEKPLLLRINETTGKIYEGRTRVFVTHLAQAPAVDITKPSSRNKTLGYATFVKALEPGKTRAKSTSAGDLTLQVRSGGSVLKDASTKLEPSKRYSVFAVGTVDAIELVVKPAATGHTETFAVAKPKKSPTPKPTPTPTP